MIASNLIKTLDIPKTKARVDTLQSLIDAGKPLSIFELKEKLPAYNESTLYRNLDKFIELKVVKKLNLNNDYSHFEFQPLNNSKSGEHSHAHHHHIVCIKCKSIECLDICGIENLILPKIQKLGFTNVNHTLEFTGICKNCSDKEKH